MPGTPLQVLQPGFLLCYEQLLAENLAGPHPSAAGHTDRVWTVQDIVALLAPATARINYPFGCDLRLDLV